MFLQKNLMLLICSTIYYKGVEHNANAIYTNLQNKYYDNDKGYFTKTKYKSAERWARSGRFAITVKYNTAGSGHMANQTTII